MSEARAASLKYVRLRQLNDREVDNRCVEDILRPSMHLGRCLHSTAKTHMSETDLSGVLDHV